MDKVGADRPWRTVFLGLVVVVAILLATAGSASATPPSILSEGVSGVTETDAVLEASIIPGHYDGWPDWDEAGGAYYQFQIAPDPSEFWPEVTCPEENPESPVNGCLGPYGIFDGPPPAASIERRPGDLPTERLMGSTQPQAVSLDLGSAGVPLEPSTTYHYRVIAVELVQTIDSPFPWYTPPVYGADQTFSTPPFPDLLDTPPALQSESGPSETSRDASASTLKRGAHHRRSRCARMQSHAPIAVACRRSLR